MFHCVVEHCIEQGCCMFHYVVKHCIGIEHCIKQWCHFHCAVKHCIEQGCHSSPYSRTIYWKRTSFVALSLCSSKHCAEQGHCMVHCVVKHCTEQGHHVSLCSRILYRTMTLYVSLCSRTLYRSVLYSKINISRDSSSNQKDNQEWRPNINILNKYRKLLVFPFLVSTHWF